jgi:hypothetical protein
LLDSGICTCPPRGGGEPAGALALDKEAADVPALDREAADAQGVVARSAAKERARVGVDKPDVLLLKRIGVAI